MHLLVMCIVLTVTACKAQDCIAGSLYNNVNANEFNSINRGSWYVNLLEPCTCSGKVLKYKVEYYEIDEDPTYVAYAALWKPREGDSVYDRVDTDLTKFEICEDCDDKRKKRDDTEESHDIDVSDSGLYVRKGSFVGIYFENSNNPLPVIGKKNSGAFSVCYKQGLDTTLELNCTSDFIETNLVIFAEAQIEEFECSNAPLSYPNTGNRYYIDGDKEYGARVSYECNPGYQDVNGHDYLTCDENNDWVGITPNCMMPVTCGSIISLENGHVSGIVFIYQSTVSFSCITGYNLNGSSSITCEASGSWSDDIPTCTIVECQDQEAPINGYKADYNLTYGSSIQFGCDNGYDLSVDSSITCQTNGTWSGTVPNCIPVNCTDINNPVNGMKDSALIAFGSIVSFECDEGYYINGPEVIICEADMLWNDSIPTCVLIDCGNPGDLLVSNGSAIGSDYSYGSVIRFECDEAYYINGTEAIICEADMLWNDSIPTCVLIDCGDPSDLSNGSAIGSDYSYSSIIRFECDEGYELNGSSSVMCGDDGNWNASTPSCNLVNCGEPIILDNYTNVLSNSYSYQSIIEFECIPGYELDGNKSAVCLANGEWNVTSPSCEPVNCNNPGFPVNGSIANGPALSFTYNTIVEYECDKGYTMVGWPIIVCNANKNWNGTVPICEIVNCDIPDVPLNGKHLSNDEDFVYQSIVHFECDNGYQLEGNYSIVCTAMGSWSSFIPSCYPLDCGELDEIENGKREGSNYTYGYSVQYECDIGYMLTGSNVLQCTENGTWNASVPVCELVQCSNVSIPNGTAIGNDYTYESMLNFSCYDGYNLNGTGNITCQSNGEWTSSAPTCLPVDCGDPGTPMMGSQNNNATYTFGSVVTFACNEGYELQNDSNTTICQADGNWTNPDPPDECSIIYCETPGPLANGQVVGSVFTFGSTINFICNSGFVLVGESSSICLKDKSWSTEAPTCRRVCSQLQVSFPLNVVNKKSTYSVGNMIIFSCSSGYDLIGELSLICNFNGQWNGPIPTCQLSTSTTSTSTTMKSAIIETATVSTTPTDVNVSTEDSSSSSFGPLLYGVVVGVVIVLIVIVVVTMILILLFFKNQRVKKKKYNVSNGGFDGPISSNGSNMLATSIDLSTRERFPVSATEAAGGMASAYEEPITLRRNQTDTMIKPPYGLPPAILRGQKNTMVKRDLSSDETGSPLSIINNRASEYEIPVNIRTLVKKDLSSVREGKEKTNTMVKRDLPVGHSIIYDEIESPYSKIDKRASEYEIPVTIVRTDQSRVTEDLSEFDLPPLITAETSFIDDISTYDNIEPNDEVPQIYSELNQAFEQIPVNNTTDATNVLYSEVDSNLLMNVSRNASTLQKSTTASRQKTVVFEPPATETDELFMQLKRQNVKGIKSDWIHIGKTLGSGYFGNVCKGKMTTNPNTDDTIEVAIKTLNDRATEGDKIKFLQEAAIMAQFDHTNVLKLHGVVVTKTTCMIVTELMSKGDLLKVLKKMRPDPGLLNNEDMPFILLNFCRQVCFGLSHLSQKGFVHRDIAARNILVDANSTCKIADFGLSRDLDDDDYYMANEGAKVPVKWTAPEALHYRKYSSASDVWSYGCLLYEIWGLGEKPFQKMTNIQSLEKVDNGYRLPPPPGCPKEFYNLMIKCWHPDNNERPCFQDIMLTMIMQDKLILSISEEDISTHPLAGTIGATLEAGEKMYEKLQMTYS